MYFFVPKNHANLSLLHIKHNRMAECCQSVELVPLCLLESCALTYAQIVFLMFSGQQLDFLPSKNNMSPEKIVIGRLFSGHVGFREYSIWIEVVFWKFLMFHVYLEPSGNMIRM